MRLKRILFLLIMSPLILPLGGLALVFKCVESPKFFAPPVLFLLSSFIILCASSLFLFLNDPDFFQRLGSVLIVIAVLSFPSLELARTEISKEKGKAKTRKFSGSESWYAEAYIAEELENIAKIEQVIVFVTRNSRMLESIMVAIGTLQWGFGDILVTWVHSSS